MKRWRVENYPHLHTPLSASIVLQWVLRQIHSPPIHLLDSMLEFKVYTVSFNEI